MAAYLGSARVLLTTVSISHEPVHEKIEHISGSDDHLKKFACLDHFVYNEQATETAMAAMDRKR